MKIKIRVFASVKDICGFSEKELIVSEDIKAGQIIDQLCRNNPDLSRIKSTLLYAVNEDYCDNSRTLSDGDILAVFPPVSGG